MPTITSNSGAYTIVGAASLLAFSMAAASGSYAVTGTAAVTQLGHPITAVSGSYSIIGQPIQILRINLNPTGYLITGQAATLIKGGNKTIVAATTSYSVTGTAAKLEKAIEYDKGVFTYTGTAATLLRSGTGPFITAVPGGYTVTGVAAGLLSTVAGDSGDYNITGTAATLRKGWTVQANTRAFVIAGTAATLKQTRRITAAGSSYGVTGVVANLIHSTVGPKVIQATGIAYNYTGTPATLVLLVRSVAANSGSYTVTGKHAQLFSATRGQYSVTGTPALFVHNRVLIASPGAYSIVAPTTALRVPTYIIQALSGTYITFGFAVPVKPTRYISAVTSTYSITGTPNFLRATRIHVDPGVYTYTGVAAGLTGSRVGRWRTNPKQPRLMTKQPVVTPTWDEQPPAPGV